MACKHLAVSLPVSRPDLAKMRLAVLLAMRLSMVSVICTLVALRLGRWLATMAMIWILSIIARLAPILCFLIMALVYSRSAMYPGWIMEAGFSFRLAMCKAMFIANLSASIM